MCVTLFGTVFAIAISLRIYRNRKHKSLENGRNKSNNKYDDIMIDYNYDNYYSAIRENSYEEIQYENPDQLYDRMDKNIDNETIDSNEIRYLPID